MTHIGAYAIVKHGPVDRRLSRHDISNLPDLC